MKTTKTVVHSDTIPLAMQRIYEAVAVIPHHRAEHQGTKVRLFGPTGPAVIEYRAASTATCICSECKLRREKEASMAKFRAWQAKQPIGRLVKYLVGDLE